MTHKIKIEELNIPNVDEKKSCSKYFITINSNKTLEDLDVEKFQRHVKYMLSNLDKFITVNSGYEADDNMIITVKLAFEVGSHQKRYHAHSECTICHNSNIKINTVKMHKCVKKHGYHIDSRHVNDDSWRVLKYIKKAQNKE